MALVHAPFRTVACDYYAFGAFAPPPQPHPISHILWCGALCLAEVVPSSRKSLKWRRIDCQLVYFTLYNIIICVASNGGQTTWLLSALVRSHLKKCGFAHKCHWYTFHLEQSHATITHLVHWRHVPASSYEPHSLLLAVHCL